MIQRLLLSAGGLLLGSSAALAGDVVAVQAGTVHTVAGEIIEGGGTVVVVDGKIAAVGKTGSVDIPVGARTVDYGASAVITPGLVAVDSRYGSSIASDRTADTGVRAVDNFDPYTPLRAAMTSGVTTVYMAPARNRLVAGQGAVVKSDGSLDSRVVRDGGLLHGSISADARRTPGYWEPPVPATVDVGLGVEAAQLPRTTMGALIALDELLRLAGGEEALAEEYGAETARGLAELMGEGASWRMGANSENEVRALLSFFGERGLPLVIDGAQGAAEIAEEIAAAGVHVIVRPDYRGGRDFGKSEDADWPGGALMAALVEAGVPVAVAAPTSIGSSDLLFAAGLAMRGGVTDAVALRSVTLGAAETLGVADRVGSIAPGKDADLAIFSGHPLAAGAAPMATWIDGDEAWNARVDAERRAAYSAERAGHSAATARTSATTVISVDELHLGDGHVLSPGEVLLRGGKVVEVGARVGRPAGAVVVRGAAAMPGIVDALGYLGLEGSNRPFSSRNDNTRVLVPGDRVDRQVASYGVTTVHLGSRGTSGTLTPTVAYKPAASTFGGLVVDGVAAGRMKWSEDIVVESGGKVREALQKAVEYKKDWDEYAAKMAEWTPPADDDDEAKDDESDEESDEDADEEEEDEDDDKKKGDREDPRPVTGVWEGTSAPAGAPEGTEPANVRLQLHEDENGQIEGNLRVSIYDELMPVSGHRDGYDVHLQVTRLGETYAMTLAQAFSNDPKDGEKKKKKKKGEDEEPVEVFLRGEVKSGEQAIASVDVTQASTEFRIAKRPELRREEKERERAPKGQPKRPSTDPDLEVLKRAMAGRAAVMVEVQRGNEIVACVDAFAAAGIKPILITDAAAPFAARIRGKVAGVLPRSRSSAAYAALASAGLPIAFHSAAEEGAAELATVAMRAVAEGLSPTTAIVGLTSGAAKMLRIDDRVGTLSRGKDADVVLLDGSPYELSSSVIRVWVGGEEIR